MQLELDMMRRLALAALLILLFCCARPAAAQTCYATVNTLNFGNYTGAALDGVTTGTVTCAGGWTMPMNAGLGVGATETTRYMTALGGAELAYKLYTNAARTNNWGDTNGNELTGNGNTNVTVYALVTAGQTVAPGTYTDTMTSATATYTVIAFIPATCTITATTLAFGNYTGALINQTSTLTVNCTNKTVFDIGLDAGTATGATVTTRKMQNGANLLNYSLYQNSTHATNWGNTVGTDTVQATGTGAAVPFTVYGQLPAGQFVAPGAYKDTITATVTY
jgi:spore coat protein U-like protein